LDTVDLHAFNLETGQWRPIAAVAGSPPSPRHSHAAVVYQDSMYIFGGYDGSYRSDFHSFHFPTGVWRQIVGHGDIPRARYRGTCVVCGTAMILHGGHDGTRHLQDTHIFDFISQTWSTLVTEGPVPSPRDSHVAVIYGKSMFLYGGSTGSAMGDFHELKLEFRRIWSPVQVTTANNGRGGGSNSSGGGAGGGAGGSVAATIGGSTRYPHSRQSSIGSNNNMMIDDSTTTGIGLGNMTVPPNTANASAATVSTPMSSSHDNINYHLSPIVSPGARFCHVGVVYENSFYIFGGYDGANRLNDFLRYRFDQLDQTASQLPSTILNDLRKYVNSNILSDVQFVVEGQPVYAHKILCLRCPYFYNMLMGEYMESHSSAIVINDVKYMTFVLLLEYLYTDEVKISVDTAMELFQLADRFAIDRLKQLCEQEMLNAIDIDTAAYILYTADQHNAENLREQCMDYILRHFDRVSRSPAFEEMGRTNVDLSKLLLYIYIYTTRSHMIVSFFIFFF
jgi:leucine-zipper-like transcriptional regulator 1